MTGNNTIMDRLREADKENAVERTKDNMNAASVAPKRSVSQKTALRTKSSNAILGGPNKARRVGKAAGMSFGRTESYRFDPFGENKENEGKMQRLTVPRDSPEFNRIRKSVRRQALEELPVDESTADFSDSDLDVETVPVGKPALDEILPDGYQPIPKEVLGYVFARKGVEKKVLDAFEDPLDLDLDLDVKPEQKDQEEERDLSALGLEVELEFPEDGEESEEQKLESIKRFYEQNRDEYKPKRV